MAIMEPKIKLIPNGKENNAKDIKISVYIKS